MVNLRKKNLIDNEKDIASLNPKKLINYFYDKIDITTSAIIIFIAIFIESLVLLFLKLPNVVEYFTINLIVNFIYSWIIIGTILFILLYLVKGKSNMENNAYKKILSGLAAFRVISIFSILIMFAIILIFVPKLLSFISLLLQNPSVTTFPALGAGSGIGVFLLIIFGIGLFVYYLVMIYHFIERMYNFNNFFKTFFMMIIMFLVLFLLSYLVNLIF